MGMEALAGPLVAAIIGSATLLLAYLGQRNKADVSYVDNLEGRIEDLVRQVEALQKENARLERQIEQCHNQIHELRDANTQLMERIIRGQP